jgi:hypothetical protein
MRDRHERQIESSGLWQPIFFKNEANGMNQDYLRGCVENMWNGLPSRPRRQLAAENRGRLVFNGLKIVRREYRALADAFVLLLVLTSSVHAASLPLTWRWSNPRPHGNNIAAMTFGNGWTVQVGERGQIYLSRDLNDWIPYDSRTTNDLRSATFFGSKIVITGENGTVLVADSGLPRPNFQRIDLGTSDWLEGVTASPSLLVAVGDNGATYTSHNGTVWLRQSQTFTTWLRGVAYGNGSFVAVGETGLVATSSDGVAWQRQTSGVTEHLNQIAWVQNRSLVVGDSGRTLASTDGRSWQTVATGAANALYTITASPSSVSVAGESELRLQENGVWADQIRTTTTSFPAPNWTYLSSLWDGSLFLLGGRTGLTLEGFKTNAASPTVWVDRHDALRNWIWDVTRTPEFYIAVGDRATVMTSENGIDWNLELVPDSLASAIFLGVGGTTNLFLAVGNQGRAMISANGVIWDAVPMPASNDLQGVAALNNNLLVVTGGGGTILTSPNGTNWTAQSSLTTAFLSSVAAGPTGLVAVGAGGTILQSLDGRSWNRRAIGTTNWIYRVRYLGGQFLAVGQNGTLLSSPEGASWTARSSGTAEWLNDVARVGQTYFAAGAHGTVLRSDDAVSWENIGAITHKSLFALASSGGQLIAAGVEGVIFRSQVIPDRTPVSIKSFSRKSGENAFLFSGQPDQRFTLDHSTDLFNWKTGTELEFRDSSAALIHLETSPVNSDRLFFRATLR